MPSSFARAATRSSALAFALALGSNVTLAGCAANPAPTTEDASASPTATPAETDSPITVEELGAGDSEDDVDVEVDGPATVTFRRITLEPGAGTGLHCHYGQLIAVVEAGELTHHAPIYPDGVHVYEAGDTIVEGASYVHEGVNDGDDDVVLLVTYVTAEGKPLAETDLAHCDPVDG